MLLPSGTSGRCNRYYCNGINKVKTPFVNRHKAFSGKGHVIFSQPCRISRHKSFSAVPSLDCPSLMLTVGRGSLRLNIGWIDFGLSSNFFACLCTVQESRELKSAKTPVQKPKKINEINVIIIRPPRSIDKIGRSRQSANDSPLLA